jgi:hypothetical protein
LALAPHSHSALKLLAILKDLDRSPITVAAAVQINLGCLTILLPRIGWINPTGKIAGVFEEPFMLAS